METKLTKLLNIKYPIMQGGMAWVSDCNLAAAVSNAGGLGIIAAGNAPVEYVREQIQKAKQMTDKPFGVNIMLMSPFVNEIVDLVCEEKVAVVTTGAGNPGQYVEKLKGAGIKLIPVVPSVALAKRMEKIGADAVIAEGAESGGHIGELTTMALLPQVVAAVNIPVVAAGGIATGSSLAATLLMGACGVQMGTVFLASNECNISDQYKEMVVSARDTSTAVTGNSTGLRVRAIKNKLTKKILEMEAQGLSAEEIENFTVGSLRKAVKEGSKDEGTFMAGQIAGIVSEVKSVNDIIQTIMEETKVAFNNSKIYFE